MSNEPGVMKTSAGGAGGDFIREENLPGHFREKSKEPVAPQSKAEPGKKSEDAKPELPTAEVHDGEPGQDPQLDRALELLKSWQVFRALLTQKTETG
jgi:hypothetical protein